MQSALCMLCIHWRNRYWQVCTSVSSEETENRFFTLSHPSVRPLSTPFTVQQLCQPVTNYHYVSLTCWTVPELAGCNLIYVHMHARAHTHTCICMCVCVCVCVCVCTCIHVCMHACVCEQRVCMHVGKCTKRGENRSGLNWIKPIWSTFPFAPPSVTESPSVNSSLLPSLEVTFRKTSSPGNQLRHYLNWTSPQIKGVNMLETVLFFLLILHIPTSIPLGNQSSDKRGEHAWDCPFFLILHTPTSIPLGSYKPPAWAREKPAEASFLPVNDRPSPYLFNPRSVLTCTSRPQEQSLKLECNVSQTNKKRQKAT